ncbi:hypothetical protein NHF50_02905 [Flavobacterium sp. NRK F10]|uniref:hypothetical protein n=1 Tax=Flavobacterium sp. NRK F10 TaxID=2954931 RepID=UPI00209183CD|nr:hypothetical protein [Flavobacterium sp. NRK F10]MCO6173984.1 hypothetical protein [Flavobacterium sp. NRK F10]
MAGEGFMMNAIQSLKFNKAQRRSKKSDWKDYAGQEKVPGRDSIKATPELLESIRSQKQKENKKRNKIRILFIVIYLSAILLISTLISIYN